MRNLIISLLLFSSSVGHASPGSVFLCDWEGAQLHLHQQSFSEDSNATGHYKGVYYFGEGDIMETRLGLSYLFNLMSESGEELNVNITQKYEFELLPPVHSRAPFPPPSRLPPEPPKVIYVGQANGDSISCVAN